MPLDRDAASADALLTDLYLDALLAGVVLDLTTVRDVTEGRGLDPALVRAAERLRHDLVRVHPSFRFEERLALQLAEAAAGLQVPLAVGGNGRLVPFPIPSAREGPIPDGADAARLFDLDPTIRRDRTRPLLIGGALTSAAISIAGAALVAWRLGRPGRAAPMARAARAVREARLAAATALPTIDPVTVRRRPH
ncbi:MAG: hypothetical protein H0U52_10440 [Chloroflexi bacterium]|nr:hypothetical protein [Chloroflexota bacterium]